MSELTLVAIANIAISICCAVISAIEMRNEAKIWGISDKHVKLYGGLALFWIVVLFANVYALVDSLQQWEKT